ncbi:unnamed protein product [Symbiodinium pilosum]|uniref:Uncharacterized protein n=1 Tax=Symbiodinium pilosum TaxID=2952 RepID=A0A812WLT4_SYMPI|nr:unnamed protein product [Symbiodinium pilosum]
MVPMVPVVPVEPVVRVVTSDYWVDQASLKLGQARKVWNDLAFDVGLIQQQIGKIFRRLELLPASGRLQKQYEEVIQQDLQFELFAKRQKLGLKVDMHTMIVPKATVRQAAAIAAKDMEPPPEFKQLGPPASRYEAVKPIETAITRHKAFAQEAKKAAMGQILIEAAMSVPTAKADMGKLLMSAAMRGA